LITTSSLITTRTSTTDLARENGPVIQLLDLYEKFGFVFDHIYGFELKFVEPSKVYREQLPPKYMSSFHWINAGMLSTIDTATTFFPNSLHVVLLQQAPSY